MDRWGQGCFALFLLIAAQQCLGAIRRLDTAYWSWWWTAVLLGMLIAAAWWAWRRRNNQRNDRILDEPEAQPVPVEEILTNIAISVSRAEAKGVTELEQKAALKND